MSLGVALWVLLRALRTGIHSAVLVIRLYNQELKERESFTYLGTYVV